MSGGPQVVQFSTPPVPAQTRTLQLHVEVNQFYIEPRPGTPPAPQRTAVPGPVTFDFTLEYHGGLVVTPHQTVTVKALSVTLERVRISPSETIIEGTTKGTFPRSPDYTLSLDAAGRSPGGLSTEPEFEGDSPFSAFTLGGIARAARNVDVRDELWLWPGRTLGVSFQGAVTGANTWSS